MLLKECSLALVEVVGGFDGGELVEEEGVLGGDGFGVAAAFFGGGEAGIADAGVAGDLRPMAGQPGGLLALHLQVQLAE